MGQEQRPTERSPPSWAAPLPGRPAHGQDPAGRQLQRAQHIRPCLENCLLSLLGGQLREPLSSP